MARETVVAKAEDRKLAAQVQEVNIAYLYEQARKKCPTLVRGLALALRQGMGLGWICRAHHQEERNELMRLGILIVRGEKLNGECRDVIVNPFFRSLLCPQGEPAAESYVRRKPTEVADWSGDPADATTLAAS